MNAVADRARDFAELGATRFDLLIVGGGIVGAGIARDAALRGLRTALVEQHDFAYGTSSRSSRLLHGGLRYLAQGRVGLVREASVEKTILHRIAPHLAEPLPFIFPTYQGQPEWRLWQLKVGVKVYDWLCSGHNLGKSTLLTAAAVTDRVTGLRLAGLNGAVRYFDGFTNDARLVLDTLRAAAIAGATVINYCRFESSEREGHSEFAGWKCCLTDQLGRGAFHVRARAIVNATGPWAEEVPRSAVKLRVTKGIHLVVERSRLPVPETVVMTEGKRILFAIPWGERTILGTTDTDYTGSADLVEADLEDIRYVLEVTNQFFPGARLGFGDVVSTWAGLRPLLADPDGKPSDISRSHQIRTPEPGWWDVAGGKLTTYRLMAEQTVDRVIAQRSDLTGLASCVTATQRLLPASETQNVSGILPPEFCRRVVEHYCVREWAIHVADVMVRRTSWQHYHRDAAAKAEHVARWMGELHGWTESQRDAELAQYRAAADCAALRPAASSAALR